MDGLDRHLKAVGEDPELPRRQAARDDVEARVRQRREDLAVRGKPSAESTYIVPQLDESPITSLAARARKMVAAATDMDSISTGIRSVTRATAPF